MTPPLRSELSVLFGEIYPTAVKDVFEWREESSHMLALTVPGLLRERLGHSRIYCNRAMAVPLRAALDDVVERGLDRELYSFDGCFNIRKQRGDILRLSVHSWGMAVDFNASQNELGTIGRMHPGVVMCFEGQGFVWGGRWAHRPDPMHFQFVRED